MMMKRLEWCSMWAVVERKDWDNSLCEQAMRIIVLRTEQDVLKFIHDPRHTHVPGSSNLLSVSCCAPPGTALFPPVHTPDNSFPDRTGSRSILCKTLSEC